MEKKTDIGVERRKKEKLPNTGAMVNIVRIENIIDGYAYIMPTVIYKEIIAELSLLQDESPCTQCGHGGFVQKQEPWQIGELLWWNEYNKPVELIARSSPVSPVAPECGFVINDNIGSHRTVLKQDLRKATPAEIKEYYTWRHNGCVAIVYEHYDIYVAVYIQGARTVEILQRTVLHPDICVMPDRWRQKLYGDAFPWPESEGDLS